jgi:hypothetical protein
MKKYYFPVVSALLLLFSLIGFSDNLITDVGQQSNSDPKFIIHGFFWFAWMLIFVIQTNFIRKQNYHAHRQLGIFGMFTAIGVVVSTVYIFVVIYKGWDVMPFFVKANRLFLLSFVIMIWLGYRNRKNPAKHKRFIFVGTLFILEPILSRVGGNTGMDPDIVVPIIWNALFISLFIFDWITLKKIHPITYLGFIWFYCVWVFSILV